MARKTGKQGSAAGKVTAIEPVRTDPVRRRVLVGRKVVATLRDTEVESLGIEVGRAWTATLEAKAARLSAIDKARTKALDMLGRSARTRGEVVAGLQRAKFSADIAQLVADEMVEHGWIDEKQIAEDTAKMLTRRTVSREVIAEKLRNRHVQEDVAEDAATAALEEVDHVAAAERFIRQKLGARRRSPEPREIKRIVAGLARRGFDEDDINDAFRAAGILLDDVLNQPQE